MGVGGGGGLEMISNGHPYSLTITGPNVSNADYRDGGCRLAGTVNHLVLLSCFERLLTKLLLRLVVAADL